MGTNPKNEAEAAEFRRLIAVSQTLQSPEELIPIVEAAIHLRHDAPWVLSGSEAEWRGYLWSSLGYAYQYRRAGDPAENLECAIAAYENALTFYSRRTFPEDWAAAQLNLSNAYQLRTRGDRARHMEKAIKAARSAQSVYTGQAYPPLWAIAENNLAGAYVSAFVVSAPTTSNGPLLRVRALSAC